MQNRRDFLKTLSTLPFWLMLPMQANAQSRKDRTLILIELKGGNDGLNTVIPFTDPTYYKIRPKIAVSKDHVLPLSNELAFPSELKPLFKNWEQKELAIILGVGYPNPNLSHFRSIEIWETASESEEILDEGWIARLLADSSPKTARIAEGIILGASDSGPLSGPKIRSIAMRNPDRFFRQAKKIEETPSYTTSNPALKHILDVQNTLYHASNALEQKLKDAPKLSTDFPDTPIGRNLAVAAKILLSRISTDVIKISYGSFDTHSRQKGQHERLLQELAVALEHFQTEMKSAGLWQEVLIMTYSEFGRRAYENGSGGTDHGTSAPHFLLGGRVKGGFYGRQPLLTELVDGNLRHHVDFRSLYATIAQRWWNIANPSIYFLKDSLYPSLDCMI